MPQPPSFPQVEREPVTQTHTQIPGFLRSRGKDVAAPSSPAAWASAAGDARPGRPGPLSAGDRGSLAPRARGPTAAGLRGAGEQSAAPRGGAGAQSPVFHRLSGTAPPGALLSPSLDRAKLPRLAAELWTRQQLGCLAFPEIYPEDLYFPL